MYKPVGVDALNMAEDFLLAWEYVINATDVHVQYSRYIPHAGVYQAELEKAST